MPGNLLPFTMSEVDLALINQSSYTKVLIIDDDEAMIEMLKLVLDTNEFELHTVTGGRVGIESARVLKPDLVILDLLIPDMDGWEVCKSIRDFTQVPILVLSAVSKPNQVAKVLDEGADDYLLKPMTSSVLVAHVKRLARRAKAEQQANNSNN